VNFLQDASDHPDDVVCVNCISVLDGENPGILFEQGFVSGQRAGLCMPCVELMRELLGGG
jgi:hypothetical protein